jgi:hypothetical protein
MTGNRFSSTLFSGFGSMSFAVYIQTILVTGTLCKLLNRALFTTLRTPAVSGLWS